VPPGAITIVDSVDVAPAAASVPEPAALVHCTVFVVVTVGPLVVVTVIRCEHHAVRVDERITGVSRVSGHVKLVVARLPGYIELTVLGVVPGVIT